MKFLFLLLISSTGFAMNASQSPCPSSVQEEARAYELDTASLIEQWIPLLNMSTDNQAANAIKILKCTQNVLSKGLKYYCGSLQSGNLAMTYPMVGNIVYLDFDRFSNRSVLVRQRAILHEATHKCGTTDAAYFSFEHKPKNVGFYGWSIIASTYDYWVDRGFCIPPGC